MDIKMRQVGVVRNELKESGLEFMSGTFTWNLDVARARDRQSLVSDLIIDEDLVGIADGLEDFSHMIVLYWAHLVPPDASSSLIKVHPLGREDFPLVGVFATCSPIRPNAICITVVRLLERKGNMLRVTGLDAIDGSPILDIKPYSPGYLRVEDAKIAGWMQKLYEAVDSGGD